MFIDNPTGIRRLYAARSTLRDNGKQHHHGRLAHLHLSLRYCTRESMVLLWYSWLLLAGITHWQSPNFFAYFCANSSFPAMLGEMLSNGLATVNFSWICSPAATELEKVAPASTHMLCWRTSATCCCTKLYPHKCSSVQMETAQGRHSPCQCLRCRAPCVFLQVVLDWLGRLLMLPQQFLTYAEDGTPQAGGGVIQVWVRTVAEMAISALPTHSQESCSHQNKPFSFINHF